MANITRKTYPSTEKYASRLYRIWTDMRYRCNCQNAFNYADYGGRGIEICSEWDSYSTFETWAINNGYSKSRTIDRINNNGNYEPSNCRWATPKEQSRNRRNSLFLMVNGEKRSLSECAEIYGINRPALTRRIFCYGWDTERALSTPIRSKHTNNGGT